MKHELYKIIKERKKKKRTGRKKEINTYQQTMSGRINEQ
jgi:hypothetical protein